MRVQSQIFSKELNLVHSWWQNVWYTSSVCTTMVYTSKSVVFSCCSTLIQYGSPHITCKTYIYLCNFSNDVAHFTIVAMAAINLIYKLQHLFAYYARSLVRLRLWMYPFFSYFRTTTSHTGQILDKCKR